MYKEIVFSEKTLEKAEFFPAPLCVWSVFSLQTTEFLAQNDVVPLFSHVIWLAKWTWDEYTAQPKLEIFQSKQ